MNRRSRVLAGIGAGLLAVGLSTQPGCDSVAFRNITKTRQGALSVTFINSTPYTVSFSYMIWDAWDRNPGSLGLFQARIAANGTEENLELNCPRNISIATQELVDRVEDLGAFNQVQDFDANAFDDLVHFSVADAEDPNAGLPTAGTAEGDERLLGVHFSCDDRLIYTFVEDPDAPGGFRIDFQVAIGEPSLQQ